MIPVPLLIIGKVIFASGISLVGHRFAMRAQKAKSYADQTPAFNPAKHMGAMSFEGLAHGPLGKVDHRFTGTLEGRWMGGHGIIEKTYTFSTGEVVTHHASLLIKDGKISGDGSNIKNGIKGEISGNTLHMTYTMTLPKHAGGMTVEVDDWYYAMENGSVINRSQIRKLGYPIADITSTLRPN